MPKAMSTMTSVPPAIRRSAAMVAVAGAYATIVAGCGSGGHAASHATPSGMSNVQSQAIVRELTQCIRQHGVPNYPDMSYDPRTGKVHVPPGTRKPPPSTMNACRSIASRLPPEGSNRPPTPAEMAKLRELSRCMRQHGIADWPDPNANGAFALPARLRQGGKVLMRPQLDACQQYFPDGGIHGTDDTGSGR
jgi:hypothetical protein